MYGPKLGGILDVSLIAGVMALLSVGGIRSLSNAPEYRPLVGLAAMLATMTLVAALLNHEVSLLEPARYVRVLFSTAILGAVSYTWGLRDHVGIQALLNSVAAVLLLNSVAILLQVTLVESQDAFAVIYEFTKSTRTLRGFGLTAGYNAAGFLATFGMLISIIMIWEGRIHGRWVLYRHVAMLFVFAVSVGFTSRMSMLLASVVLAVGFLVLILSRDKVLKIVGTAGASILAWGMIEFVLPLYRSTVALTDSPLAQDNEFVRTYANTSVSGTVDRMLVLPGGFHESFFGSGVNPGYTDIGYVSIIGAVGGLGLLFLVGIYAIMLIRSAQFMRLIRAASVPQLGTLSLAVFGVVSVLLLFVMNLKGLYMGTRGFHELLTVTFFFMAGIRDRLRITRL